MFNSPLTSLGGLRIVPCDLMSERTQVRFPRSKKRRIRKKWAKRPENYADVPMAKAWQIGRVLVMHPEAVERFRIRVVNARQEAFDAMVYGNPAAPEPCGVFSAASIWPAGLGNPGTCSPETLERLQAVIEKGRLAMQAWPSPFEPMVKFGEC